ncbi:MAG: phosphoribosyl-ATP diphosphatase [Anaerolineales bacterium]|nr:phosphoribosyl-ATP diphosphatase [Anaerolineales bacterium]
MLYELFDIILDRKENPVPGSYTNSLLDGELGRTAQKVGEEGVEVIIAALSQTDQRLIEEASDLIYHLYVLLARKGITLQKIEAELNARHK